MPHPHPQALRRNTRPKTSAHPLTTVPALPCRQSAVPGLNSTSLHPTADSSHRRSPRRARTTATEDRLHQPVPTRWTSQVCTLKADPDPALWTELPQCPEQKPPRGPRQSRAYSRRERASFGRFSKPSRRPLPRVLAHDQALFDRIEHNPAILSGVTEVCREETVPEELPEGRRSSCQKQAAAGRRAMTQKGKHTCPSRRCSSSPSSFCSSHR